MLNQNIKLLIFSISRSIFWHGFTLLLVIGRVIQGLKSGNYFEARYANYLKWLPKNMYKKYISLSNWSLILNKCSNGYFRVPNSNKISQYRAMPIPVWQPC